MDKIFNSLKVREKYKLFTSLTINKNQHKNQRFNAAVVWFGLTGDKAEQVSCWEARNVNQRRHRQSLWQPTRWHRQRHLRLKGKTV